MKTSQEREENKQTLWLASMEWGARFGCHQKPKSSLFLGRWQMPVCARCFGFWLGSVTALPAALLGKAKLWLGLLALPMAADGLTQRLGKRRSNNPLRYATGWLAGYGATAALLKALPRLLRGALGVAKGLGKWWVLRRMWK